MPPPALTIHVLVPHGHGTELLVADEAGSRSPPSFALAIGRNDRLVPAVQRHLREAWALDPVILETHCHRRRRRRTATSAWPCWSRRPRHGGHRAA